MKKCIMSLVAASALVISNAQAEILGNLAIDLNPQNLINSAFIESLLQATLPVTEAAVKRVDHEVLNNIPGLDKKVLVETLHRGLAVLGFKAVTKKALPTVADAKDVSKIMLVGVLLHLAKQGYGKVIAVLHDEESKAANPVENLSPVHSLLLNAGVGSVIRTLLNERVPFLN